MESEKAAETGKKKRWTVEEKARIVRRYLKEEKKCLIKAPPFHFVRGHWEIENRLPWVRDTVFREDTCTTRTGNGAHVISTLRNMTISLLRVAASKSIAPVLDSFSNKSSRIFRFLGLLPKTSLLSTFSCTPVRKEICAFLPDCSS